MSVSLELCQRWKFNKNFESNENDGEPINYNAANLNTVPFSSILRFSKGIAGVVKKLFFSVCVRMATRS